MDVDCSCRHTVAVHHGVTCFGFDSYDTPCACPSFELSQESREQAEADGRLAAVEAFLTRRGFNPQARQ